MEHKPNSNEKCAEINLSNVHAIYKLEVSKTLNIVR